MKNKFVASMLALFLGIFGVHWFYLGRNGRGLFYIFLFIAVPFKLGIILGIIDAIKIMAMPDYLFDRKFNSNAREDTWSRRKERWDERQRERKTSREWERSFKKNQDTGKASPFVYRRNLLKEKGLKKIKEYDFSGAIQDLIQAGKDNPKDAEIPFHLACAYSIMEKADEGYSELSKAVELGFKDIRLFHEHDLLAYLRIQPQWDDFVKNKYKVTDHQSAQEAVNTNSDPESGNLLDQLKNLALLRQNGLLTDEQYVAEKERLLG